jgi:hypothetical protein
MKVAGNGPGPVVTAMRAVHPPPSGHRGVVHCTVHSGAVRGLMVPALDDGVNVSVGTAVCPGCEGLGS